MSATYYLFGLAGVCDLAHLAIHVLCRDPKWDYEIHAAAKEFGLLMTTLSGVTFAAMGCIAFIVDA